MGQRVRAKLFVASVRRQASAPDTIEVEMGAVTRGEANKNWAEATPSASFKMTIQNPEATTMFVLGRELYVDFTLAEQSPSLADGHAYKPGQYEQDQIDKGTGTYSGFHRCAECNAKRSSHEEPLRSQIVAQAGIAIGGEAADTDLRGS